MQEFQVCVLSDSKGWMSARVTARWRSEERRMRYLGDVMMTEFENPSFGYGVALRTHVEKDLNSRLCQGGHVKKGLNFGPS